MDVLILSRFRQDGFIGSEDCDDTNDTINPNATEVCDGLDNNCDGNIDDSNENLSQCEEVIMDK